LSDDLRTDSRQGLYRTARLPRESLLLLAAAWLAGDALAGDALT
jgi:hypothetical protein